MIYVNFHFLGNILFNFLPGPQAIAERAYAPLLGGEQGVSDVVADTFLRAFESAATFDAGGITDPERLRRRTRAWLGRIAERLVQNVLRHRRPTYWEPELLAEVAEEPPPAVDSPHAALVREALSQLTEREQIVLRTTFQWHRPGDAHQVCLGAVAGGGVVAGGAEEHEPGWPARLRRA